MPTIKPSTTKFLRDARAIAKAWGVAIYDKRKMRAMQLEPVHAAMRLWEEDGRSKMEDGKKSIHPPSSTLHPRRAPNGWPKEEVVTWGLSHMELNKDRRTLTLVKKVRSPESTVQSPNGGAGEPPATSSPEDQVTLAEREAILARFPADYQTRYRGLYEKWRNPNSQVDKALTGKEYEELIAVGLVKKFGGVKGIGKPGPVELPEYCSQSEFARLMSELYNVPVYPMMVSRAITEEGMLGKMSNQSLKMSLAHPWWEENKVKQEQQGSLFQRATAADLEKKIVDLRRATIEADEAERAASNRWLPTALVENFIEGAWTWVGMQLDKLIEDKRGLRRTVAEAGAAIGLTTEQRAQLDARLADALPPANDQFKKECAGHMDELIRQLADERKDQLANRVKN